MHTAHHFRKFTKISHIPEAGCLRHHHPSSLLFSVPVKRHTAVNNMIQCTNLGGSPVIPTFVIDFFEIFAIYVFQFLILYIVYEAVISSNTFTRQPEEM
jgi:hypothetical protein